MDLVKVKLHIYEQIINDIEENIKDVNLCEQDRIDILVKVNSYILQKVVKTDYNIIKSIW